MKKIMMFVILSTIIFVSMNLYALRNSPMGLLSISFSSKAYWDGTMCAPREKGCCFHIEIGGILRPQPGQITGDLNYSIDGSLIFTFSKTKGLLPETLKELCKSGKFIVEGEGTFQQEVLERIGYSGKLILPAGAYPYKENGDLIEVKFK